MYINQKKELGFDSSVVWVALGNIDREMDLVDSIMRKGIRVGYFYNFSWPHSFTQQNLLSIRHWSKFSQGPIMIFVIFFVR